MKTCTKCKTKKPLTEFHKDSRLRSGHRAECKECCRPGRKARHDPVRDREQKLWNRYKITQADYDKMLNEQGGKCKICRRMTKLVVDHCHTTGRVRGLLCDHCNTALGLFKDSTWSLFKAIAYLSRR